jgi:hypothetical protein
MVITIIIVVLLLSLLQLTGMRKEESGPRTGNSREGYGTSRNRNVMEQAETQEAACRGGRAGWKERTVDAGSETGDANFSPSLKQLETQNAG